MPSSWKQPSSGAGSGAGRGTDRGHSRNGGEFSATRQWGSNAAGGWNEWAESSLSSSWKEAGDTNGHNRAGDRQGWYGKSWNAESTESWKRDQKWSANHRPEWHDPHSQLDESWGWENGNSTSSSAARYHQSSLPHELQIDYKEKSLSLQVTGRQMSRTELQRILTPWLRCQMWAALKDLNPSAAWHYITVDLNSCQLRPDAMEVLMRFLVQCRQHEIYVRILKLFRNKLGDEGVRHLCRFVLEQPKPMHEVHLSHNSITDAGAAMLILSMSTMHPQRLYPFVPPKEMKSRYVPCWCRMERNMVREPAKLLRALENTGCVRVVTTNRESKDFGPLRSPSFCTDAEGTPQVALHLFSAQDEHVLGEGGAAWKGDEAARPVQEVLQDAMDSIRHILAPYSQADQGGVADVVYSTPSTPSSRGCQDTRVLDLLLPNRGAKMTPDAKPFVPGMPYEQRYEQYSAGQCSSSPCKPATTMPLPVPAMAVQQGVSTYDAAGQYQTVAWYQVALSHGLQLHSEPSICAPRTGAILNVNELFAVSEELPNQDGRVYLRLADGRGFAYDDSMLTAQTPSVRKCVVVAAASPQNQLVASPTLQSDGQWTQACYSDHHHGGQQITPSAAAGEGSAWIAVPIQG
mmetsp:Transcript_73065/g.136517  ORF Transcript_73065/g.136517 Transcript_73065/m.136517 type:complete len:631 (+) Transcript_73065:80-1972(+)